MRDDENKTGRNISTVEHMCAIITNDHWKLKGRFLTLTLHDCLQNIPRPPWIMRAPYIYLSVSENIYL